MSPEQAFARPGIGPAADIWAMGVVAYECLTGVRPFRAPTLQALFQKISKRSYAPAHDLCPDVPVEFDEWFRTACEPNPYKRFPDTAVAAAALLEALGIQPNARAMLDAEITGSISQSFRSSAAAKLGGGTVDIAESSTPSSDSRGGRMSSKPAPFVRSCGQIDRSSPASGLAMGALALAAVAAVAVVTWGWTRADALGPDGDGPVASSSPAPAPVSAKPLAAVELVASAEPAASWSASPEPSAPPPFLADAAPPRFVPTPARTVASRPPVVPAPEPSQTVTPPGTSTATPTQPPKATASGTPASPFQLPDLGL